MNENPGSPPIPLGVDDKIASVMMYFANAIFWGDIVIRKQFKPSTWLTTNAVPDIIHLQNPRAIFASSSPSTKPTVLNELLVPSSTILASHQVPPNFDPVDYDLNEPNMQMCPVDAFLGTYHFNGKIRFSTKHTLLTYLEITHVAYLYLYEVVILNTFMPSLGAVKVPFALVRKEGTFINLAK